MPCRVCLCHGGEQWCRPLRRISDLLASHPHGTICRFAIVAWRRLTQQVDQQFRILLRCHDLQRLERFKAGGPMRTCGRLKKDRHEFRRTSSQGALNHDRTEVLVFRHPGPNCGIRPLPRHEAQCLECGSAYSRILRRRRQSGQRGNVLDRPRDNECLQSGHTNVCVRTIEELQCSRANCRMGTIFQVNQGRNLASVGQFRNR